METKKDGFIPVYTWMLEDYDLSLTDAVIYALIYSFSRDEQGCYFGSIRYIVDTCKVSESTAKRSLKVLEEKGLLRKWQETVGNVTVNRYSALRPAACTSDPVQNDPPVKMNPVQNDTQPPVKMTSPPVQNEPQIRKREKNNNKLRACAGAKNASSSTAETPADVFVAFANGNSTLLEALHEFDQHRRTLEARDKKKPWTALAAKKICKSLLRLAKEAGVQNPVGYMIAMLDQSVENGWTGVFVAKDFIDRAPAAPHRAAEPDKPRIITSDMTLADLLGGA